MIGARCACSPPSAPRGDPTMPGYGRPLARGAAVFAARSLPLGRCDAPCPRHPTTPRPPRRPAPPRRPRRGLRDWPADGRRHLHGYLVGLDLEQIVARLDGVADRLEPGRDLAFRDGLAELRHQNIHVRSSAGTSPIHRDILRLEKFHHALMGALAADAALLGAAERRGGIGDQPAVKPDHAEIELFRYPQAAA